MDRQRERKDGELDRYAMKQMYKQTIRQTDGNTEEQMDRPREGKEIWTDC